MSNLLAELLEERDWLLADGATGTNLMDAGLEAGGAPETWNLERPEGVLALHRSFVAAGADILLTNSFGGTRNRMKLHQAEPQVAEVNATAARLARQVADEAGRPVVVAGSMGPTGELFEPLGSLTPEEGRAAFTEQALALAEGGADALWIETLSSVEELEAAVAGAKAAGLPYVCTLTFDTKGHTMMGLTPADMVEVVSGQDPLPQAYGGNCGTGPAELIAVMLAMRQSAPADHILVAKSNCGIPELTEDGSIRYSGTPEIMADYARLARDIGVRIIGGCCGTTAVHLEAMRQALEAHEPGEPPSLETIEARLGPISRPKAKRRRTRD